MPACNETCGALAGDIVLCSWARHLTLRVPPSTLVYKWVPANVKGHSFVTALTWTLVFSHFRKSLPQPEIKVHQEICFIFHSVLLDFQLFTEKPVFECPFAHPMILFLCLGLCYMQIN